MSDTRRPPPDRSTTIVCIGAGFSGVALGARLKISYDFTDIAFYDRSVDIGGTWLANTYPGVACDVPTALYSLSFAQNPAWTDMHPSGPEIREYISKVAADYDIPRRTTFRTEVFRAEWDDVKSRWYVWLRDLEVGKEYVHECKILFSATGLLCNPVIPEIPGQKTFKGVGMHSAQWDHSVSLEGKNVAILGNGCTAAQIVPSIAPKAASVTQFIRTKHWIIQASSVDYTPAIRWCLINLPLVQHLNRLIIFLGAEWGWRLQGGSKYAANQRAMEMKKAIRFMRRKAPAKFHDLLIPDFQISCKRRIIDPKPSYLVSLNRPNIHLTDERVVEITPNAVRTSTDKEYPIDVIVYATGFRTDLILANTEVRGRDGITLHQYWENMGGPGAYNCTANHSFPNFFVVLGPNSGTGHTSALMASENTINYALKVLKPVLEGHATTVEIKKEAEADYVRRIQKALGRSIFNTGGCASWYTNEKGWNGTMYPWSQAHFLYSCTFVKKADWITTYTSRPPAASVTKLMVIGALLAVMTGILSFSGRLNGVFELL